MTLLRPFFASRLSAARLGSRSIFLFPVLALAGGWSAGFAVVTPAPLHPASGPLAELAAESAWTRPSKYTIERVNPCSRRRPSTWVPVPDWDARTVLDFDRAFLEAMADRRLSMLVIYAEGCAGWTRTVSPLTSGAEVLATIREWFHVYGVSADDREQLVLIDGRAYSAPELVEMLGIEHPPAFVLFDHGGRVVQVLEHPESTRELLLTIDNSVALGFGMVMRSHIFSADPHHDRLSGLLDDDASRTTGRNLASPGAVDDQPLAVFFEDSNCHHCDHLRQSILADSRILSLLARFRIARLEPSSDAPLITPLRGKSTISEWAMQMGISETPTVVLFSSSGQYIGELRDHTDMPRLKTLLNSVISGAYRIDPAVARDPEDGARFPHDHGYEIDSHLH